MIVERYLHYPKPGRRGELVDLILAERQRFPGPHAVRLYSHNVGSSAPVALELEFESYGEREKHWAAWQADPGTAAFLEKLNETTHRYWTNEIWNLEE